MLMDPDSTFHVDGSRFHLIRNPEIFQISTKTNYILDFKSENFDFEDVTTEV